MFHWKQDYHNRTTWRPREVIHNFKTFSYRKIYFKIDFNYLKSITILKIYFNCGPLVFYGCFPLKIFPFSWLLLYYISYFTMLPWYKYFPVPVDHLGSIDQLWKQKHWECSYTAVTYTYVPSCYLGSPHQHFHLCFCIK